MSKRTGRPRSKGRPFTKEYWEKWRSEHPNRGPSEKAKANRRKFQREYYRKNRERLTSSQLNRSRGYRYGLRKDEYEARLLSQEGICALCKQPFAPESGYDPVLDHCHERKKLRQFIHRRCNLAIGYFRDDPVTCRLAAEYLERHSK
jgi:hypothetical protein